MKCKHKKHKHLTEEQMDSMITSGIKDHVKSIRIIQEVCYKADICEGDFFTALINVVVHMGEHTIRHLEAAAGMSQREAVDMIIGNITRRLGVQYYNLNMDTTEIVDKVKKAHGIRTH